MASNFHEKRRLEHLKRELQLRLIEREMARDQGVNVEDTYDDLEARYLGLTSQREERVFEKRQVIEDCRQGDIIFVVDSSGSIGVSNWHHVLDFMNEVIDKIGVGPQQTHVGALTYGNRAHIQFQLNNFTDSAPMKAAVSAFKYLDENTNTSGGMATACKFMFTAANGDRTQAPNVMVVITDGVSTYDNHTTVSNAAACKSAGITVVSIGVGNLTSQAELEAIASVGKDGKPIVLQVVSYAALDLVNTQLANVACDKEVAPAANVTCEQPTVEVVCPDTSCKNKCKFGFAPNQDGCLTCQCLPEVKPCP
jgi:collagen type VI alpha